jgi:ribosomal peptide maturation radical SAM protein 1
MSSSARLTLISMPWSSYARPSAALSALAAFVEQHVPEVSVQVRSEYVEAAQSMGIVLYSYVAERCFAIGEALYGSLYYPEKEGDCRRAYVEWAKLYQPDLSDPESEFAAFQARLDEHARSLAEEVAASSDVVGFTCSFAQLFASLLVARRIKEKNPECVIVLGGPSVSSAVGPSLLREYPFVDYIVQGEGELPLAALLRARLDGAPLTRSEILTAASTGPAAKFFEVERLDDLPEPNYDDYARRAERYDIDWHLPIEGSRGCWYDRARKTGDPTQTCFFCNLNVQWNGYREKSVPRVAKELASLSSRYRIGKAFFVDNIMRHRGVEELAHAIAALDRDLDLFYENRANLKAKELLALWEAGLSATQFGIEALSTSMLKRIGKGTTMIQNLEVMRLCTELEIDHIANLITDFPGSTEAEVNETVLLIDEFAGAYQPLHLYPFELGRGSTVDALRARFGIVNVRNADRYRPGLPDDVWSRLELIDLDFELDAPRVDWSPVHEAVERWTRRHNRQDQLVGARGESLGGKLLVYRDCVDFLIIEDLRDGELSSGTFEGLYKDVYLECLSTHSLGALAERFPDASEADLQTVLDFFVEGRLMVREGDRYLSLALATSPRVAAKRIRAADQPAFTTRRSMGRLALAVVD